MDDDAKLQASSGLRERARRQLQGGAGSVVLGDAQSQAYFHAKRFKRQRRAPVGKKRPAEASSGARSTARTRRSRAGVTEAAEAAEDEEKQEKQPEADELEEDDEEDDGRLVLPPHGEVVAALQRVDERERVARKAGRIRALPTFEERFELWKSQMRVGNSVLLSGAGSKLALLQEFAATTLQDGYVLQVHGYLPTVSLRYLCNCICDDILHLKHISSKRSLTHQCQEIARRTARSQAKTMPYPIIYLIVHEIDGTALRTPELQTCLSWLASSPCIHLIASIEHINGSAMWQETDTLRFQWVAHSVSSQRAYTTEIELQLVKRSRVGDLAAGSGVKFILQSLTPTDVGTLQEVARQQIANAANKSARTSRSRRQRQQAGQPIVYQLVFDACRKKLLHTSVQSMKNSVKCLEDHGLLRLVRAQDTEHLEIPLPEDVIKEEILLLTDGGKKS